MIEDACRRASRYPDRRPELAWILSTTALECTSPVTEPSQAAFRGGWARAVRETENTQEPRPARLLLLVPEGKLNPQGTKHHILKITVNPVVPRFHGLNGHHRGSKWPSLRARNVHVVADRWKDVREEFLLRPCDRSAYLAPCTPRPCRPHLWRRGSRRGRAGLRAGAAS